MARKKCRAVPCPKLPSSVHSAPAVDQNPPLTPNECDPQEFKIDATQTDNSNDSIRHQCRRAFTSLQRGNHIKALKIMKETCSRHPNSAIAHGFQCRIYCRVASQLKDPVLVQKHLKNAVESARLGDSLSPNSVMFPLLYARMLHDKAKDDRDFEEAAHVCRRALAIEKPVDPLKDGFLEDNKNQKPEARIAKLRMALKKLLNSCYASHSFLWRSVPVMAENDEVRSSARLKPLILDPEFLNFVETKKQSEAVESIMQSDPSVLINEEEVVSKPLSRFHRLEEKRKHTQLKKVVSSSLGSIDQVRSYWNNLGMKKPKDFTKVKIEDLKAYLGSFKDVSALKLFLEAVWFAKENKTWRFWSCPCCREKSKDFESSMQHLKDMHLDTLTPDLESVLPKEVDGKWVEILNEDMWKPIDTELAVRMIEIQSESQSSIFYDSDKNECKDLKEDPHTCIIEDKMQKLTSGFEDSDSEEQESGELKINSENWKWPFSEDTERVVVLQEIKNIILLLKEHKCLSQGTINELVKHCLKELKSLTSNPKLLNQAMHDFPLCMCFLDAFQLKKIFKFLEMITESCDFSQECVEDNSKNDIIGGIIRERVVFSNDFSILKIGTYNEALSDDGSAAVHAIEDSDDDYWLFTDTFITWLYTIDEHLISWKSLTERKKRIGAEIFMYYEKEWQHILDMCERHHMAKRYVVGINAIHRMCLEELGVSVAVSDGAPFNCEAALLKRQKELVDSDMVELELIKRILVKAEAMIDCHFPCLECEEANVPHFPCTECGEDEVSRIRHYNNCIRTAILNMMEELDVEFYSYEARILWSFSVVHQLELTLKQISEHDYRSIILDSLKNFIREHLEDLAKKDAAEKSDAAREVLLKEIALDAQKVINKGGETKKTHKKSKDKQRRKGCAKAKSLKESSDIEQCLIHPDSAEKAHFSVGCDGDCPDSDFGASAEVHELKQFDDDLKDEMDIEALARKLEEFVEYQIKYENEAKQTRIMNPRF